MDPSPGAVPGAATQGGGKVFWFEQITTQAGLTPEATAVTDGERRLTYAEVEAAGNRLARYLQSLGAGPEKVIAVLLPRSERFVRAFLAVGKASAAVMPLDLKTPPKRLAAMLARARPDLIVTDSDGVPRLPETARNLVRIDDPGTPWEACEAAPPPVRAEEGGLCYVFFTSGSTGQPKGVEMTFQKMQPWCETGRELAPGEVVLMRANPGFTLILRELHWVLGQGGHIWVMEDGRENDLGRIAALTREHGIRRLHLSPTLLALLLEEPAFAACGSIEEVFTVGESLQPRVQRRFFEVFPEAALVDFYGCTEATALTMRRITRRTPLDERVLLGREKPPQKIFVLDETMRPVADGQAGEIFAGGYLARGYRNDPELTAERFPPNPFAEGGERLYRTGDLARRLPDGQLEYLGRRDFQVQLGGARVELNEVAAALCRHSGVRDAVALAVAQGDRQILCAFAASPPPAVAAETLREALIETLPPYMVPARIYILDTLPLNANGKTDLRALRLKASQPIGEDDPEPPGGATEKRIAEIFGKILGRSVGRNESFFALGGDSLGAIVAASRISTALRADIAPAWIYLHPTVARLAALVDGGQAGRSPRRFVQVSGAGADPPLFIVNLTHDSAARAFPERRVYHAGGIFGETRYVFARTTADYVDEYFEDMVLLARGQTIDLIGYSWGGLVAYELARRFAATGKVAVNRLVLVEPLTPTNTPRRPRTLREAYRAGRRLPGRGGVVTRALLASALTACGVPISQRLAGSAARTYCELTVLAETLEGYHGRVDLVVGEEFPDADLSQWRRKVTGPLRVHHVSGHHHALMDDAGIREWKEAAGLGPG